MLEVASSSFTDVEGVEVFPIVSFWVMVPCDSCWSSSPSPLSFSFSSGTGTTG